MNNLENMMNEVSWTDFYKEKLALLEAMEYIRQSKWEKKGPVNEWLEGLLGLMDTLGDKAEEMGLFEYPQLVDDATPEAGYQDDQYNNLFVPVKKPEVSRRITENEFLALPESEDNIAVRVKDGEWTVLYMHEFFDAPMFCSNVRLLEYGRAIGGGEWVLNKNIIGKKGETDVPSLIAAVVEKQGEMSGGIYFCEEGVPVGTQNSKFLSYLPDDKLKIYRMKDADFIAAFNAGAFTDGLYLFSFFTEEKTEKNASIRLQQRAYNDSVAYAKSSVPLEKVIDLVDNNIPRFWVDKAKNVLVWAYYNSDADMDMMCCYELDLKVWSNRYEQIGAYLNEGNAFAFFEEMESDCSTQMETISRMRNVFPGPEWGKLAKEFWSHPEFEDYAYSTILGIEKMAFIG